MIEYVMRHCEAQSAEAIKKNSKYSGLLRYARNDGKHKNGASLQAIAKQSGILFFIFFICLTAFGQKKIENKLTEEHQNIKGTKVSLIPPAGFADSTFLLLHAESGSIIITINIPAPYSNVSETDVKKEMAKSGIKVSKIELLTINGLPATFTTGTMKVSGNIINTAYCLLFGNETESVMILGHSPKKNKEIGEKVKNSILSVYYDANKAFDPFEKLDFSIDISKTKLKFTGSVLGLFLMYKIEEDEQTSQDDRNVFIVQKSSLGETPPDDKKSFAINHLKKTSSLEIENIEYVNEITIDGLSGYEICAKGINKEKNRIEKDYQVILFTDNSYYLLSGVTNDETGASIEEFKKAIQTFKRK